MSDEPADVNASSHTNSMSALFYPVYNNINLFYRAVPGTIFDVYTADGKWYRADLTKSAQAPPARSKPTALVFEYKQSSKAIFLFYQDNKNHIGCIYYDATPPYVWHYMDLGEYKGVAAANGDPTAVAFYPAGRYQFHVYYRDIDNHIFEVYYDDGKVTPHDLTALTKASPAGGDPSSVVFVSTQIHVLYRNNQKQICDIWWDGTWHYSNLSAAVPAAPAAYSDPAAVSFQANELHVFYRDKDNRICDLYYSYGWKINELGKDAPPARCDPVAAARQMPDQLHASYVVFNQSNQNNLYDIWWNGQWNYQNLNQLLPNAANPAAVPVAPLSFHNPDSGKNELHVFYRPGSPGNEFCDIHLVDQSGWQYRQFMPQSADTAPTAAPPGKPETESTPQPSFSVPR
jgi:hypothetical protein